MMRYFDMIHNQERVEYLMLQQDVIETIVEKEQSESPYFLGATPEKSDIALIKKRLQSEEGVRFYEQYLGVGAKGTEQGEAASFTYLVILHVVSALLVTTVIVMACRCLYHRLTRSKPQDQINFDCQQAILKKQRLE